MALLATAASLAPFTGAWAQTTAPAEAGVVLDDVIVTAQKRSESVQDVPISIQALGETKLEQHKVVAVDDFVKLLPSVSMSSVGPSQSSLYFRGISTGSGGFAPSVGFYLDETPVTSGAGTLDVHIYDVSRVEALSGPQGTLYGASSLAGTLRVITNKPDPSGFSAGYDLQADKYGKGAFGGMVEGYANFPLSDRAALRVVGYYKTDGGYIDVVPGTVRYTLGDADPTTNVVKTNASLVEEDTNTLEVLGGRAALGIDLNDDWTMTASLIGQQQKSEGTFMWDPKAGDLNVRTYSPTGNEDKWAMASLVIEGKIGDFDLVAAGSYLKRHYSAEADYTYYSVAYDSFPGYTKFPMPGGGFLDPTQVYNGTSETTRETFETRISSPSDLRFRATGGVFYQRFARNTDDNYLIKGVGALPRAPLDLPPVKGDTIYWIGIDAENTDSAVFGEAAFDILPNLTLTAGIRGFKSDQKSKGFVGIIYSALARNCTIPVTLACQTTNTRVKSDGETHKINLTWKVDDDRMVYATYSTGFRVGGPNVLKGVKDYEPDILSNYETGFKTTWFDNRLRVNGAIYYEKWSGIQYRLATPGASGLSAVYNAGDARVYGAELDFQALLDPVVLSGTMAYNDAQLATNFCNIQSAANPNPFPTCTAAAGNIQAPKGTRLPNQPKFKGSVTGRYNFEWSGFDSFASATVNHQTSARNTLGLRENTLLGGDSPGFTTVDLAIGGSHMNKSLEFFIQNVFDKRGELNRNTWCQVTICGPVAARVYTVRPQFFGLKFRQEF